MKKIKEQIKDYQSPQHTIDVLKNLETQNLLKNSLLSEMSEAFNEVTFADDGMNTIFKNLKIQIDSTIQATADLSDIHCTVDLVCDVVEQVCKD